MVILPSAISVSVFDTQTPILGSIPILKKSRYFSDTRYSIPIVSNNPSSSNHRCRLYSVQIFDSVSIFASWINNFITELINVTPLAKTFEFWTFAVLIFDFIFCLDMISLTWFFLIWFHSLTWFTQSTQKPCT